ncbi:MAG: antibiotic biosynthesis monooxygenase [Bacteroidaceae bacterium]|nr:antibiotic biosynthesis monooxygenase [Bacteroidaceae bacterium]
MEGEAIRVNCHIVPKDPAQKEAVVKLAKELVEATQKDAGMVEYDLLESVTRPNELMIYETWKDQASLDAHSQAEHFTTLLPQIKELADVNADKFKK